MQAHNGKALSTLWCMQNLDITCFVHRPNILNNQNSEYACPLILTNKLMRISSYICAAQYPEKSRNNRYQLLNVSTIHTVEYRSFIQRKKSRTILLSKMKTVIFCFSNEKKRGHNEEKQKRHATELCCIIRKSNPEQPSL